MSMTHEEKKAILKQAIADLNFLKAENLRLQSELSRYKLALEKCKSQRDELLKICSDEFGGCSFDKDEHNQEIAAILEKDENGKINS